MHSVPIKLDKERSLRFGMKAIDSIEKKLGKPSSKIDYENLTMEEVATFIWAGLKHEDKKNELTPEKVMDLIDEFSDLPTVMKAFEQAYNPEGGTSDPKN